jgi:hypothetical protein
MVIQLLFNPFSITNNFRSTRFQHIHIRIYRHIYVYENYVTGLKVAGPRALNFFNLPNPSGLPALGVYLASNRNEKKTNISVE